MANEIRFSSKTFLKTLSVGNQVHTSSCKSGDDGRDSPRILRGEGNERKSFTSTVNFNWKSKLLCSRYSFSNNFSSFTPHYKSILNGLTAAPTRLYSCYFSILFLFFFFGVFALPHLYLLMPINLISLRSSKKKKENLIYVLVYVEHSFLLCFLFCAILGVVFSSSVPCI